MRVATCHGTAATGTKSERQGATVAPQLKKHASGKVPRCRRNYKGYPSTQRPPKNNSTLESSKVARTHRLLESPKAPKTKRKDDHRNEKVHCKSRSATVSLRVFTRHSESQYPNSLLQRIPSKSAYRVAYSSLRLKRGINQS